MISDTMKDALTLCIVARAKYMGTPNQQTLSDWDDAWTHLMEVRYAPTRISDPLWTGLADREKELGLSDMAFIRAVQRDQLNARDRFMQHCKDNNVVLPGPVISLFKKWDAEDAARN